MRSPGNLERRAVIEPISSSDQKSTVRMNPTNVTGVSWGIYQPDSANMGVIKLENFIPQDIETKIPAIEKAIMIIRSLLVNEFKDTNSVMYDLRDNPGGSTKFADTMVQFFKFGFEPYSDSFLINNITFNLFVRGKDPKLDPFAKAWQETKPGSRYSSPVFASPMEAANTMGQHPEPGCWNRLGEDGRTGGGGAAVLGLDPTLITASPDDFKKLPFSQELASGPITYANALSVVSPELLETGLYKGQEIEDAGIKADIVVRARWSDLQPNSTTNTQYERIAASLASIGQKSGQSSCILFVSHFRSWNPLANSHWKLRPLVLRNSLCSRPMERLFAAQQKVTTNKQKLSLPVSTAGSVLGNSQLTIVGKTEGRQVLKTIRNVKYIPADDKYIKIGTPGFTFTGTSESVGLYQSTNYCAWEWLEQLERAMDDWQWCQSSGGVEDFFLSSKGVNDTTKTFNGVSGGNMTVKGTFPFTTKSDQFSVALRFTSDAAVEATGATIRSFTVAAA
ncbi:hypothetical protein BASA83_003178 [Batrachochytrium salamandrivorans]|nr:hypothetical protein BASA83_003178 [Batrachochytrium salamandrivorans]